MKHIMIVPDGLADNPGSCENGQTPMSVAHTPHISSLAQCSKLGRVRTVPEGLIPGSDVANMYILGYRPEESFTGRASIEAAAHDIAVGQGCTATRLNFVTLSYADSFEQRKMLSFNAGGVSNGEATELLKSLSELVERSFSEITLRFCESFHHVALTPTSIKSDASPPHDFIGQAVDAHLPTDPVILEFIKQGAELLSDHPVNTQRRLLGKMPINGIWLWSSGEGMHLESFEERYDGKRACMITATDVLRGLAKSMDVDCIRVNGANGTLDTNYKGKGQAAVNALLCKGYDLAYIHIEAPDAAGHAKRPEDKIIAYERIDEYIVKPIIYAMSAVDEPYRLIILPDHYTSTLDGNHGAAPVPYMLYDSTHNCVPNRHACFNEAYVHDLPVINADMLITLLLGGDADDRLHQIA